MASIDTPVSPQRTPHTYLLTLWAEQQADQEWIWRGVLQRTDGTRTYFHTLAELNQLVREWEGWHDPPPTTPYPGL
jgi:hypothetical protein